MIVEYWSNLTLVTKACTITVQSNSFNFTMLEKYTQLQTSISLQTSNSYNFTVLEKYSQLQMTK